jgi:hypothetical protein
MSKGARKFAEAKDADGNTVIEFMGPPRSDDALSECLRILTYQLMLKQPENERGGGLFGGAFGCGVAFENDVFMMHPYCWCEKDGCLWCGGSCGCGEPYEIGHYLDGKRITEGEYEAFHASIEKPLPWKATKAKHGSKEYKRHEKVFDDYIKERDRRSGSIWPPVVHTCAHPMFFSRPEEIWSIYSPQPYPHSAPHFWHKASGLRVWWYKYIGRDNVVSWPSEPHWQTLALIFESILASIGGSSLEDAVKAYAQAQEEEAEHSKQAFEFMASDEGQKAMQSLMDSGALSVRLRQER